MKKIKKKKIVKRLLKTVQKKSVNISDLTEQVYLSIVKPDYSNVPDLVGENSSRGLRYRINYLVLDLLDDGIITPDKKWIMILTNKGKKKCIDLGIKLIG